jgi:hypothetical protein
MSNAISSAFLNPSNGISGFGQESNSVGEGGNSAIAKVLQDIENLLNGGQNSGGAGGANGGQGGGANGAGGQGDMGGLSGIQQLLQDLQALEQGDSQNGGQGGGQGGGMGGGMGQMGGMGGMGGAGGVGGGQGQGLHDVKLNTKAGGEALHLQADSNGTLYNGSGNSVGQINQDGSVSLNSGATKEIQRLETGGKDGLAGMMTGVHGHEGDGGNVSFSSSEVTVSAGDLNQKNDF